MEKSGIKGYQEIKEKHIAMIFPSDSGKNYRVVIYEEISPLLDYYKKRNEKIKLYFCHLTDDFLRIVKSPYVYGIHIFGHGRKSGLTLEDGVLQYRELKNTKPKEFVAQWHCNHGEGESLGELIGKKYFVPYGLRNIVINKRNIKKLVNDELDWEINKK